MNSVGFFFAMSADALEFFRRQNPRGGTSAKKSSLKRRCG